MEEKELTIIEQEVSSLIVSVQNVNISNQEDFEVATEFTKKIKEQGKKVVEYWKSAKDKSYQAWKDICSKEKENLQPLEEAEKILKSKIAFYYEEQEKIRRAKELEIQKLQQAEMLKKQKEAEKLRAKGNEQGAVLVEEIAKSISTLESSVESNSSKVEGLSFKTTYNVVIENEDLVPTKLNGITIRPVDISTISKLAQSSKGQIKIDGVKIIETKTPIIRS